MGDCGVKTKAVVFPEANKFEIIEVPLREMGPRDMLVETLVTAISPGTERWILFGKHLGTKFPCIPGYQRIGIVKKCGEEVKAFKVGDIVYGGGYEGGYSNIVPMWGAHIGLSVNDWTAYRFLSSSLPDQFELEALSYGIVASVATRGIRFCNVKEGEKILVIGAGFIGICAAQLALRKGAKPVLLEKDPERVEFAKKLGFNAFNVDEEDLDEKLRKYAPEGFDVLYDTAGHAKTTNRMVRHMKYQGIILLQSQYFDLERCALDLDQIKIRELTMRTTCGIRDEDWLETINYIKNRYIQINPLITHRLNYTDALEGYKMLSAGKPFNLGIIFYWSEADNI